MEKTTNAEKTRISGVTPLKIHEEGRNRMYW
jgi:hypothetical protein